MLLVSSFSRAPFYSKIPRFAKLRAENNIQELAELALHSFRFALYLFVSGVLVIGTLINPFFSLIDSNISFIPITMWLTMGFFWLLERNHSMHDHIYSTTNHIPFYIPLLVSGTLNILIVLILLKPFDIWAFPIAHGASNMVISNWWNVKISVKSIGWKPLPFLKQSLFYPGIIYAVGAMIILMLHSIENLW